MKYVIYQGGMYPWDVFLFPVTMNHSDAHRLFSNGRKLVSAGKVGIGNYMNGQFIAATPGSVSLKVKWSKEAQEQDDRIIRMQFREF